MDNNFTIFLILAASAIVWAIWYLSSFKDIGNLKVNYEQALKGNDRKAALMAGRAYYGALRRYGKLTVYDELAIANDLSTMECGEHFPDLSEAMVS